MHWSMPQHTVQYRRSFKNISLFSIKQYAAITERFDSPVDIQFYPQFSMPIAPIDYALLNRVTQEEAQIVANWLSRGFIPDHSSIKIDFTTSYFSGTEATLIVLRGLAAGISNGLAPQYLRIEAWSVDDKFAICFAEIFNKKKLPDYFSLDLFWSKFTAEGTRAFARIFENTCSYKFSLSIPYNQIEFHDRGILLDAMDTHIQNCPTCTTTPYLDIHDNLMSGPDPEEHELGNPIQR